MASQDLERFFIVLLTEGGEHRGHSVFFDEAHIEGAQEPAPDHETQTPPVAGDASTFIEVFDSFASVVGTYRNFLHFTMWLAPLLSSAIAQKRIGEFAKSKGRHRTDLSKDNRTVYEMNINTYRELRTHQDEIEGALQGADLLPEVMLIGLVSAYDSFLAKLLRVVILQHESIILTSEKTIKFSELSSFKSIEEARNALIDREIEAVLRESHQEHFRWMEQKFSVKLKVDLPVFPKFVEICERRNLLTHTGGVVSSKYIENCRESKVAHAAEVVVGQKLTVDNTYYSSAVDVVCEIGIKLCWVLWRKFSKDDRIKADRRLCDFCYDLIVGRQYGVAEAILSFAAKVLKNGGNDSCRRMMIVNQANAMRLQKRESDAIKLLDSEDWSAVNDEFAVSVAAVRGDVDEVVNLMERIGPTAKPNAEDYRTWPVFRGIRSDARFKAAFTRIFRVPVVSPEPGEIAATAGPQLLEEQPPQTTKH